MTSSTLRRAERARRRRCCAVVSEIGKIVRASRTPTRGGRVAREALWARRELDPEGAPCRTLCSSTAQAYFPPAGGGRRAHGLARTTGRDARELRRARHRAANGGAAVYRVAFAAATFDKDSVSKKLAREIKFLRAKRQTKFT
eukprot:2808724-Prymnesium_polylepis.1